MPVVIAKHQIDHSHTQHLARIYIDTGILVQRVEQLFRIEYCYSICKRLRAGRRDRGIRLNRPREPRKLLPEFSEVWIVRHDNEYRPRMERATQGDHRDRSGVCPRVRCTADIAKHRVDETSLPVVGKVHACFIDGTERVFDAVGSREPQRSRLLATTHFRCVDATTECRQVQNRQPHRTRP